MGNKFWNWLRCTFSTLKIKAPPCLVDKAVLFLARFSIIGSFTLPITILTYGRANISNLFSNLRTRGGYQRRRRCR